MIPGLGFEEFALETSYGEGDALTKLLRFKEPNNFISVTAGSRFLSKTDMSGLRFKLGDLKQFFSQHYQRFCWSCKCFFCTKRCVAQKNLYSKLAPKKKEDKQKKIGWRLLCWNFLGRKYNFSEVTFDSRLYNVFKETYWTKPNLALVKEVARYIDLKHINPRFKSGHSQDQWDYWLSRREDSKDPDET